MTDILERIAFVIKFGKLHAIPQETLSKAADEITHLRAENERLREALHIKFPTMLRKMWSGGEVQKWLDERINNALKENGDE